MFQEEKTALRKQGVYTVRKNHDFRKVGTDFPWKGTEIRNLRENSKKKSWNVQFPNDIHLSKPLFDSSCFSVNSCVIPSFLFPNHYCIKCVRGKKVRAR